MHTYGKKKRSILPSFSTLRDSVSSSRYKQKKLRNREPSPTICPNLDRADLPQVASLRHDSIRQLAELLLEDTITESPGDGAPDPNLLYSPPAYLRSLPQLPRLLFNGDDAWAFKKAPVVHASGASNEVRFGSDDEHSFQATPFTSLPTWSNHHARKSSVPAIPRRSSKRRSAVPKNSIVRPNPDSSEALDLTKAESSSMGTPEGSISLQKARTVSNTISGVEINAKITAMFAASEALKGHKVTNFRSTPLQSSVSMPSMSTSGEVYEGPLVTAKKRQIKENKVLMKVKTAINERLQSRITRKLHDPQRDDCLLNDSLNELPDYEEDTYSSPLSMWEIRINEGTNLKNPKITQLTGHGVVVRKPIADEGRSLKSRKSAEDSFSEPWSDIICTPTEFDDQPLNDMVLDLDFIPSLPIKRIALADGLDESKSPSFSAGIQTRHSMLGFQSQGTKYLRNPSCTPGTSLPRTGKLKSLAFETDFDALFSSSPLAQSTPRIRLEPTLEDGGKRTLKSVPAISRSVFDSDMDIDTESRNSNSGLRIGVSNHPRGKKHPSPSKTELEDFEQAIRRISESRKPHPQAFKAHKALARDIGNSPHQILDMKDSNANFKERKSCDQGKPNAQVTGIKRTTGSIPEILHMERQKCVVKRDISLCHSMMEIDELQWNEPVYDIGMKRL